MLPFPEPQGASAGALSTATSAIGVSVLKRACIIGLAAALFVAKPAAAQTYGGVVFAGGNIGAGDHSAYAGAVLALRGARLGSGMAVRTSLNSGRYEYERDGVEIEANYRGLEGAIVYQTSGHWGWTNLSAGPRFTILDLSPDDQANARRGKRTDLGLQLDGALLLRHWRLDWLGSGTLADGAYVAQLSAGRFLDAGRRSRLGVEASVQGDEQYTRASTGPFASTRLGGHTDARIAAGLSAQEGRRLQPYLSTALTILF